MSKLHRFAVVAVSAVLLGAAVCAFAITRQKYLRGWPGFTRRLVLAYIQFSYRNCDNDLDSYIP